MISVDRFDKQNQYLIATALGNVATQISQMLGEHVELVLQTDIDDKVLQRIEELEKEIFAIEDNVYSKEDILECLAEEDSILLLLIINDNVEGYAFGYDEDVDNPTVRGTDYFMDSALVSLKYEHKGLGSIIAGILLMLLYLMDYREIGLLTEEKDKTGRELVKFYKKLGFEEVETTEENGCAMKISLSRQLFHDTCSRLGVEV